MNCEGDPASPSWRMPPPFRLLWYAAAMNALVTCLASCATSTATSGGPPPGSRISPEMVKAFYAGAKDPRTYSLRLYEDSSGARFEGDTRTHRDQLARLKYRSSRSAPLPVVRLRDSSRDPLTALIDTTSAENWVAFETAVICRMIPLAPPAMATEPVHVEDPIGGYLCLEDSIHLGDARVESVLFFARGAHGGLGPLDRGVASRIPVMVLGMRLLRAFSFVQFDLPGRQVLLASSTPYEPDPSRLLTTAKLEMTDGLLAVAGVVDGRPARILLDLAGAYEAIVPGSEGATLPAMNIGGLEFRDITLAAAAELGLGLPAYPRVGAALLAPYVVTLDTRQGAVHFERPPET